MIVPGSDCVRPETQSPDSRILPLLPCLVKSLCVAGPRGLTFTWWGCYGICLRHKPTELAHSFDSVPVFVSDFMALSTVFHSLNSPNNSLLSASVLPVLFLPYWSFQLYISSWSTIYLFMKVSLAPDVILCGWLGSKLAVSYFVFWAQSTIEDYYIGAEGDFYKEIYIWNDQKGRDKTGRKEWENGEVSGEFMEWNTVERAKKTETDTRTE